MRLSLTALALLVALPLAAINLNGLNPDGHLNGPELTEKDVKGKIVVLYGFGWRCPRCSHCLPKVAKLAKDLAKEPRVCFIGSHLQSVNVEGIKAMLEKAGCPDLPAYQFLSIEGAPSAGRLLPTGYVANLKGEVIWSGSPFDDFEGFEKAIRDAIKAAPKPIPGSLADGMDIKHNADMARRLMIGQNMESVLKQLQSRSRRGGEAGEEAQELLRLTLDWAQTLEQSVHDNLEANPVQALADGQLLMRSFPSKAQTLKPLLTPLIRNPQTKALASARLELGNLQRTAAANPGRAKASVALRLRQLNTFPDKENPDFQALRGEYQALLDSLQ